MEVTITGQGVMCAVAFVALVFAFGYAIGYEVGKDNGYGEAADLYGRNRREAVRK